MNRVLAWFSCGDASAVAAKLAVAKYGDRCEVVHCDTLAYEHPDNSRFKADVEGWLGRPMVTRRSEEYRDIFDVFDRTGYLVGPAGARCTTELKKKVRIAYQRPDDVHVFGFTAEEGDRIMRFRAENPELFAEFPLFDARLIKTDCHRLIREAGIELPAMYRLGYRNNNCIGCVKGGVGYWNKIRRDFPEAFARMAAQERKMGRQILRLRDKAGGTRRIYLDELPPDAGNMEAEPDIECGVLCIHPSIETIIERNAP